MASGTERKTTVVATSTPTKDKSQIAELKNGKIVFKQKPITFDKLSETMQEIVQFREMLEKRALSQSQPLAAVPREHMPIVAKLVHESDKTIAALVKQVHKQLVPSDDDDEEAGNKSSASAVMLPVDAVEFAIKSTATRVNYGLDSSSSGGKIPAALCVWRWEVNEEHWDWLPKAAKEKAEARRGERVQAKIYLAALFDALPQQMKDDMIIHKGGSAKQPLKEKTKANAPPPVRAPSESDAETKDTPSGSTTSHKRNVDETENAGEDQSEPSPSKKLGRPKDPEKAAREREKQERKIEKVEKEKKEQEAKNKARSLMANFFGKPKPSPAGPSYTNPSDFSPLKISGGGDAALPADARTEFDKTFKPFVVKKDATIAPVNWFSWRNQRQGTRKGKGKMVPDVIVIDEAPSNDEIITIPGDHDEASDIEMVEVQADVSKLSDRARLDSVLAALPKSANPSLLRKPPRTDPPLKTSSTHSVRAILAQLSEAEVTGDTALVRSLITLLQDRDAIPARMLIFAEDARPGYYGTYTRTSRFVGPRTPFARDEVAFDYAYDSGAEWDGEEEGAGEDVADGDEEEADAVDSDADSDLDSWLVDDEVEEGESRSSPFSDTPLSGPPSLPQPAPAKKRKAEKETPVDVEERSSKRKVVVPLIPFTKGPCLESIIGTCVYEPLNPYRIQLFNDTPYPIDPFTFVSTAVESMKAAKKGAPADGGFAIPALPDRLTNGTTTTTPLLLSSTSDNTSTAAPGMPSKRAAGTSGPKPKNPFPEAHLPALLSKIETLATGSLISIVETVYQELKEHKVKKNAIEAKVREVGEKCKDKKVWVVKPVAADA